MDISKRSKLFEPIGKFMDESMNSIVGENTVNTQMLKSDKGQELIKQQLAKKKAEVEKGK